MYTPYGSANELIQQLRAGTLSAVSVMQATLDRIDALNPGLNAIVALRPRAELMAEAAAADQASERGALHGLPMAIKDLANVKVWPQPRARRC